MKISETNNPRETSQIMNVGSSISRRNFITQTALMTSAAMIPGVKSLAQSFDEKNEIFAGIQIAPHSILDEGIDYCLDFLRETAEMNCLMLSSNYYYGAMGRPVELMGDHGKPKKSGADRNFPRLWVNLDNKYFSNTTLRHKVRDRSVEYGNRDLYAELREPAHKRGMTIHERMYAPKGMEVSAFIENWENVLSVDINGERVSEPCPNNPDFREFMKATVTALFSEYEIDGIQYGSENVSPLSRTLFFGNTPWCFCKHCTARAEQQNIDVVKARNGWNELHAYIQNSRDGEYYADGVMTGMLRLFFRYPEILTWNYQTHLAMSEVHQDIYDAVKAVAPKAQVGRHVDHAQSSWNIFYRAQTSYLDMVPHSDYIKAILYHDILGPRIRSWYLEPLKKTILAELSLEQSLELYYALFGYDPAKEPGLDELEDTGFSSDYVYRETRRAVKMLEGKRPFYAGIGMDIPKGMSSWGDQQWISNPEVVYDACAMALEGGAKGIVASREYEEINITSLDAMGRAIRDFSV